MLGQDATAEALQTIGFNLHLVIIAMGMLCTACFLKRVLEHDHARTRALFTFITLFFFFMTTAYFMRLIMVFFIPVNDEQFITELTAPRSEDTQTIAVGYAFTVYLGVSCLTAAAEKAAFKGKTHYAFALTVIGSCLVIGLLMILNIISYDMATFIQIIPLIVGAAIGFTLSATYLYIGWKNSGRVRWKSIQVASGITAFIIGVVLSSKGIFRVELMSSLVIPMVISPVMILAGYVLLFAGFMRR